MNNILLEVLKILGWTALLVFMGVVIHIVIKTIQAVKIYKEKDKWIAIKDIEKELMTLYRRYYNSNSEIEKKNLSNAIDDCELEIKELENERNI